MSFHTCHISIQASAGTAPDCEACTEGDVPLHQLTREDLCLRIERLERECAGLRLTLRSAWEREDRMRKRLRDVLAKLDSVAVEP